MNLRDRAAEIDRLLLEGKEHEAVPLIEQYWKDEEEAGRELPTEFNRRLDALEKRLGIKE